MPNAAAIWSTYSSLSAPGILVPLGGHVDFHANRLASLPGVAMVTSYVTMKTLSADTWIN